VTRTFGTESILSASSFDRAESVERNGGDTPLARPRVRRRTRCAPRPGGARAVAEASHHEIRPFTVAEERENLRRTKVGLESLAKTEDRKERMLWVPAYVEYTSAHDELRAQYERALRYYRELEQRQTSHESAETRSGPK
jgi:hypothetical protein